MSYKPSGAIILTTDGQGNAGASFVNLTAAQALEVVTLLLGRLQQQALAEAVEAAKAATQPKSEAEPCPSSE